MVKICKVKGCNDKVRCKGYCSRHYSKFRLHGDPLYGKEIELHGMYGTPEYIAWASMIQRCTDKNHKNYKNYGGRGIKVCDRWRNSFIAFYNDMGKRPDNMEIDRKDNNGNYEPENCRWITRLKNSRNKRNNVVNEFTVKSIRRLYKLHKYTHKQLCSIYRIKEGTLQYIIYNRGWEVA